MTVRLAAAGHAFLPGHRLRLALSPTYWPWVWPSPEPVVLSVFTVESSLTLPVRTPDAGDGALRPFGEPECSPPLAVETLSEGSTSRTVARDVATGECVLTYVYGGGRERLPSGMEMMEAYRETFRMT